MALALVAIALLVAPLLVAMPAPLAGACFGGGGLILGAAAGVWASSRGRTLPAVGSALQAYAAGERRADALRVDPTAGRLALAWNEIVRARDLESEVLIRQEAERAVDGGERRKRSSVGLIGMLWHGVVLLSEEGMIIEANQAAAGMLGVDRDGLLGRTIEELPASGQLRESVSQVLTGETARAQATLTHGQGEETVLRATTRRLRAGDPAWAIVVVEDVTQQVSAEAARSSFVAQATHELRNPLTSIRLYVEEAIDADEDDVETRSRAIDVIQHEARRLERVIANMLSTSEIEAGSMSLHLGGVELEPMFAELRADFIPQAQAKGIELAFELPPKFPRVQADRDKLVLAVHNVIGNAIKYTPDGGRVRVAVDAQGSELCIDVQDTGIGIDPEAQARIFDRFFRAGDVRVSGETGSGLGLALAREVIRLHGGDITVVSELDKGSTFSIRAPVFSGDEAGMRAA